MDLIALWACLQAGRVVPVEEMAHKAAVIGLAEVQGSSVRRDPANGMIYTDYRLRFSDVWKGQPFAPFVLSKAGGRIGDDVAATPDHDYDLRPGETVVVFASAWGRGHMLYALRQSLYRVGDGPGRPLRRESERHAPPIPLRTLKEKVFRTLGRPLPPEEAPPQKKASTTPPAGEPSATAEPAPGPTSPAPDGRPWFLPWAFGIAALLIVIGFAWLRRQNARA